MRDSMKAVYTRLELPQSRVTPSEVILLLRDLHSRVKELENGKLKEPTSDRGRVNSVSKRKVPTS
jgi:hypothetical protein